MSKQRRPFVIAERKLDSDRKIALAQLPSELRPAFIALWELDLAFADVVATSSDPRIGAIRAAWWRERLEQLDQPVAASGEPRLQIIADELVPRGISGTELSRLEDAWLPLLDPFPWTDPQVSGLTLRGRTLFGIAAQLLGADPSDAQAAGELWSLDDGAKHCSDEKSRILLHEEAVRAVDRLPLKAPLALRPLTILAALAAFDVSPVGVFGRGGAALKHRLTGRFPHKA